MRNEAKASPAELAALRALERVYECIDEGRSFRLEAGAGAGKTYSLINALQRLVERRGTEFVRNHQQIACITFTRVAKKEIETRIDQHPAVRADTVHGFCWSILKNFQTHLRSLLPKIDKWTSVIENSGDLGSRRIEYDLGYIRVERDHVSIRHDDVISLMVLAMQTRKFRQLLTARYPIIFIDEYQDTNAAFIDSIRQYFLDTESGPLIGFFGDHWQKIYGTSTCGKIEHPKLTIIDKHANFRSVSAVVDCLNRMRPELKQMVSVPEQAGEAIVFHTNSWMGDRLVGGHWKGDTPEEISHAYLETVRQRLAGAGWDFAPEKTKILMLTHNVLAKEQGYPGILEIFPNHDSFLKKEDPHIAFFTDVIEPVCSAYESKRYGDMFSALPGRIPAISSHAAKVRWSNMLDGLLTCRREKSIGDVVDYVRVTALLPLPEAVEDREQALARWEPVVSEEEPNRIRQLRELRLISYREIIALDRFIDGHTPFSTKHNVKGAEFENVLVVLGRGWNQYDFDQMLTWAGASVPVGKHETFERNRNLFYVACSRPKTRLALLFTQKLSDTALATLTQWFGAKAITSLPSITLA